MSATHVLKIWPHSTVKNIVMILAIVNVYLYRIAESVYMNIYKTISHIAKCMNILCMVLLL